MHSVLVRTLARGDRRPQHRRKHWLQRGQVPHRAAIDQLLKVRHLARIQQRMNGFPVRAVPADEQEFFLFGAADMDGRPTLVALQD